MKHSRRQHSSQSCQFVQIPYMIHLFMYFLQCVHTTCVQLHNHNMNMQIHAHVRRTRRRSRRRRSSTHFDGKEQQTEDASSGCFVCFVCLGSMSIIRATGPGETPGDTCHCNYLQLHPLIAQPPNQRPSLPDLARVSFTLCYPQVQQLTEQPAIDYGFIASSPHRQPRHLGCVFGVVQVQTHPFPPFLTQLLTSHANLTHAQVQKYKKKQEKRSKQKRLLNLPTSQFQSLVNVAQSNPVRETCE